MKEEEKNNKIKEILPLLWNSYEHIYFVRDTNINNNINYLLVVATFLPIFCLMLYDTFKNELFLIPIAFQILALLILFKKFFIKGKIPWLGLKETLDNLDKDTYVLEIFAELKASENGTYHKLLSLRKIINIAIFLLIFSILILILVYIYTKFGVNILFYFVPAYILLILLLLFYYLKKEKFDFDNEKSLISNEIKKWQKNNGE